ncbi:dihydroxyacetone kinase family protein [Pseudolysinimonas yzui]|uniref:D-erythrulose kinase n=1 Tax=Pseudolysinimonas yzui TaxID=2708254 RepID=A0A8J3M347_9MICO|nr:dihydroxyacetone kinase family protein [Pseudolysinimonas yzui]GHF26643.1 D-erythrulose kinase [Pseudolysinimonas yzui]
MTVIYDDAADFADDQLEGFCSLYSDRLSRVPGGVVAHRSETPQVAVVVGGGSGHYPAFAGLVGPGFASGAVVGNIFTSPSAADVYSVAKAAEQGRGVVLSFGNYAGDVLNFGIAAQRLRSEGIDTRIVVVTDDVASAGAVEDRRGIAGDFAVFKVLTAAAAEGLDIDHVERMGRQANAATYSHGVAFSGCTLPGAPSPLFVVPSGQMSVGLGIHGEPGLRDVDRLPASALAAVLVDAVLAEAPHHASRRVAVILNGLGTTKHEELFLLYRHVARYLADRGLEVVAPEVGELVTSLDMGGCSLTVMWLDDELERLWCADAYAPGYRKLRAPIEGLQESLARVSQDPLTVVEPASTASLAASGVVRRGASAVLDTLRGHEDELGRLDAVAGDGDHGRGMVRGASAAVEALNLLPSSTGVALLLRTAGRAWATRAGGTSGVLWGAGLEAAADALGDSRDRYDDQSVQEAVSAFADAVVQLGGAGVGDKTFVDAIVPFCEALARTSADGAAATWRDASDAATQAAQSTAPLRARRGRARTLAERSVGTADPGAVSFALAVSALADVEIGAES